MYMKKKKLISLFLIVAQLTALIAVTACPVSASIFNPGHPVTPLPYISNITADAATEAPVIDGKIDDAFWKGTVTNKLKVLDNNSDRGEDFFGVKWDQQYLYIAMTTKYSEALEESTNRNDSGNSMSFFFDPTAHQGPFNLKSGDIQLYLGYNPKADPKNSNYVAGSNCHVFFGSMEPFPNEDALIANTKSCMTKSEDGNSYIIEAAFRWEDLMINPQNEEYFAMNIFGNDVAWSTNNKEELSFWNKTDNYGKVTLVTRDIKSLTPVADNIEVPLNTDLSLSNIKLTATGTDNQPFTITGEYYGMTATPQNSNVTISDGKIHGAAKGYAPVVFALPNGTKTTVTFKVMNIALITITPIPKQTAYATIPLSFTLQAFNTLNNPMTYFAKNLPDGANFNAETRVFQWTPTMAQLGDHTVHFDVTDGEASRSIDVEIHVGAEPNITVKPIADQVVQIGKPIAVFLSATNNSGSPITCTIDMLPDGAMFEADTMTFRWVPTASQLGNHTLKFIISDGLSSRELFVNIRVTKKLSEAIVFDSVPDQSITAGERITFPVKATIETGTPLTYTVLSKPSDAVFDTSTGEFSWLTSENEGGLYIFAVQASDGTKTAKLTVTINVYSSTNSSRPSYGSGGGGGYTGSSSYQNSSSSSTSNNTTSLLLPFKDMQNFAWAVDAVNTLYTAGIIKGTSSDTFSPAQNITRADFVVLLMRAIKFKSDNQSAFDDVSSSSYYYDEVANAKALGIIGGLGGNCFYPTAPITRQDMMVICNRALKLAGVTIPSPATLDVFDDANNVAAYANDAVGALIADEIILGDQGCIYPLQYTTRAEVAVTLVRLINKHATLFIK